MWEVRGGVGGCGCVERNEGEGGTGGGAGGTAGESGDPCEAWVGGAGHGAEFGQEPGSDGVEYVLSEDQPTKGRKF